MYTLEGISSVANFITAYEEFQQDKIFRRKRLRTGANFVHVYTRVY